MALTAHQKRVAFHIYDVGRRKKASRKDLLSALETGLVEANLGNPHGGDGTSIGWRQETSSSYPNVNRMNVRQSAARFYDELRGAGGGTPGQRAQAVQRSGYPLRYDERAGQAKDVLAWLDKTYGKGTKGKVAKPSKGTVTRSTRTSTQVVTPGVDNSQARAQVLQAGLGLKHPFALSRLMSTQAQIAGLADVAPVTKTSTQTVVKKGAPKVVKKGGTKRGRAVTSAVEAPGADRAGVPTSHYLKRILAEAGVPGGVIITTGSNHKRITSSGNVSDHWGGKAADLGSVANHFPIDGKRGDLIAAKVLIRLGVNRKKAIAMARQGGLYTIQYGGHRWQVIWKAAEHHDHVHVGVS